MTSRWREKADLWLKVRPGTDGLLALSFLNVMLAEKLYDAEFVRDWTNARLLVREGSGELLTQDAVVAGGSPDLYGVWNESVNGLTFHDPAHATAASHAALEGSFEVRLSSGATERVTPVFAQMRRHLSQYTPEATAATTGIEPDLVRQGGAPVLHYAAGLLLQL